VFFRADTLAGAGAFLKAMAGLGPALPDAYTVTWYLTPELWLALVAGAIGSTPIVPALGRWHARVEAGSRLAFASGLGALSTAALMLLLVASIMQIAARTYNPFIYFRF
jgi:alginate O-acetyltransferase complex protein AlgI